MTTNKQTNLTNRNLCLYFVVHVVFLVMKKVHLLQFKASVIGNMYVKCLEEKPNSEFTLNYFNREIISSYEWSFVHSLSHIIRKQQYVCSCSKQIAAQKVRFPYSKEKKIRIRTFGHFSHPKYIS